jgi:hypothetical protein
MWREQRGRERLRAKMMLGVPRAFAITCQSVTAKQVEQAWSGNYGWEVSAYPYIDVDSHAGATYCGTSEASGLGHPTATPCAGWTMRNMLQHRSTDGYWYDNYDGAAFTTACGYVYPITGQTVINDGTVIRTCTYVENWYPLPIACTGGYMVP